MTYVIIGDVFSFPEGDASTNRVYTYAKGFLENGINAHVVCFGNEYTAFGDGVSEGIFYYHPFDQTRRNKYFIIRNWFKILKYFKTTSLLRRINKKDKIKVIIVYTRLFTTYLFAWALSKISGSKLLVESGEHPLRPHQNSSLSRQLGFVILKIENYLCDGVFCISRFLIDFYKERGMDNRKLILLPSTVDPLRFLMKGERPLPFPYIGYFGGLSFKRDNIDLLVQAFSLIAEKYPDIHLVLGGFSPEKDKIQLKKLITDLALSSRVMLLNYLPRDEIIQYINHSDILVMVRSNGLEAQASFPCKLTEYLVTSKPVVTVNVGEISDYLADGINSFLVEPGNKIELAAKLDQILLDYKSALEIGQKGKQLTETIFNYNYQAKRIIRFVETL
jgi:glycosyltransferase involved in cell wall biosynthesis